MPIPQVNDRIKEAPVVVLRAVFAGIGQILLTADRVRARAAEQVWAPDRTTAAEPSSHAAVPSPAGPRNGTAPAEAEAEATDHAAMREAAPHTGTATAPATTTPAASTAAGKTGSGLAGSVPRPAPAADRKRLTPAVKPAPIAEAATKTATAAETAKTTPRPKTA